MRLLVVAAIPMELSAFPAALPNAEAVLVANGAGAKRAAAAVDRAIEKARPDAIVSTGFCGALDESLGIADIAVATAVESYLAMPVESARPAYRGLIRSIDHVAQTMAEKR